VIATGARLNVFAASSPPKPAPRITTLGFDCGIVLPRANAEAAPAQRLKTTIASAVDTLLR
jgi:hypothetical protein